MGKKKDRRRRVSADKAAGKRDVAPIEHPERLYMLRVQCVRRVRLPRWPL